MVSVTGPVDYGQVRVKIQTVQKLVFYPILKIHRKTNYLFCYVGTSTTVLVMTVTQILNSLRVLSRKIFFRLCMNM